MATQVLTTFSAAAIEFGVNNMTVSDLVRILGIEPKRVSTNGLAKGLDESDMKRLREVLGKRERVGA